MKKVAYSDYSSRRDVTMRLNLPPADYVIVVATYDADEEGDYFFKLFQA